MKPTPRAPRRRAAAVVAALVAVAGIGLTLARGVKRSEASVEPTVAVTYGDIHVAVEEVGSVEPLRKTDIKSKIAGQVREVAVDVGQVVKAGDVLMRLDPLDARRAVAQAEARVRLSTVQLAAARELLDVRRRGHAEGVAPFAEVRAAEADVARLDAQVALDGTDLAMQRDRLGYTEVRSPIDGVVLARNVQPGELVTPGVAAMVDGKPLLVVAQIDKVLVKVELNQLDVARLHVADPVDVRVDALPGKVFKGAVHRIAAMAQRSERRKDSNLFVFPVEVMVDRAQPGAEGLRPGMMADVSVVLDTHRHVLTLPVDAVAFEKGVARVRKAAAPDGGDGRVEITVGLRNERLVEVVSGLAEGERVNVVSTPDRSSGS